MTDFTESECSTGPGVLQEAPRGGREHGRSSLSGRHDELGRHTEAGGAHAKEGLRAETA